MPAYETVSGARKEWTEPHLPVGGARKRWVEAYVTVGGARKRWFQRGWAHLFGNDGSGGNVTHYLLSGDGTALQARAVGSFEMPATNTPAGEKYIRPSSAIYLGGDLVVGLIGGFLGSYDVAMQKIDSLGANPVLGDIYRDDTGAHTIWPDSLVEFSGALYGVERRGFGIANDQQIKQYTLNQAGTLSIANVENSDVNTDGDVRAAARFGAGARYLIGRSASGSIRIYRLNSLSSATSLTGDGITEIIQSAAASAEGVIYVFDGTGGCKRVTINGNNFTVQDATITGIAASDTAYSAVEIP